MGLFGGNHKVAEDKDHKVYEGTSGSITSLGRDEVTIVDKDSGDTTRGQGSTIGEARDNAWTKHDLAEHQHDK